MPKTTTIGVLEPIFENIIFHTVPLYLDDIIRYRQRQIKELVKFVNKSDADFVLLGGDFNVDPKARLQTTADIR